jgi:tetratricopeptide (TPR) repeat protein
MEDKKAMGSTKTVEQLVGKLIGVTASAIHDHDKQRRERIRATLTSLSAGEPLATCISALIRALDGDRSAASILMATSESVPIDATMEDRANVLAGIADIAHQVGDLATEIASRLEAISAQRQAEETRESLISLSTMLSKQATLYSELGDHPAAVSLLEEVVELDEQLGNPGLASHRAALKIAQQRARKAPESEMHQPIVAWCEGPRDAQSLKNLLDQAGSVAMHALSTREKADREAIAEDLGLLRAAHPLPVEGADTFLRLLQLRLRNEPGREDHVNKLRASLTKEFAQKLMRFENAV